MRFGSAKTVQKSTCIRTCMPKSSRHAEEAANFKICSRHHDVSTASRKIKYSLCPTKRILRFPTRPIL
jgi:hypothetical protein